MHGCNCRLIESKIKTQACFMLGFSFWENLCAEAGAIVGIFCELGSIFTEGELKSNELAIQQLNKEFNQIHRLDKTNIAISVIAGIVGAAMDILMAGILKKGLEGLNFFL